MICPRCKNQDPKYFYTFNQITYCRKCINVGSKQIVKNSFNLPKAKIDYHLDYQLKHWEEVGFAGMWLGAERKDRVQEANEKEKNFQMLIALRHRIWQLIESLGISEVFNSFQVQYS